MKIALISCSKMKQNYRCEARELYAPSQLFSLSYQYAKRYADQIYILSAKYGLIFETDIIEPYDMTLSDFPPNRQQAWANYVLTQLKAKCNPEVDEFIILAGKNYYQYLTPQLPHYSLPLGRLRLGDRIEFLERQLNTSSAILPKSQPTRGVEDLCPRLHQLLNTLPKYTWQDISTIPFQNGIYIVFEHGETYRGMPRIVRVGTHTSPNRLKPRLTDHFITENHEGSIFRKNIGKAFLNQVHDPYLRTWTLNTSKIPCRDIIDKEKEQKIEQKVSNYMRENITFTVFPVESKQQRLRMEEAIIASLNQASDFGPGNTWLGHFSPEPEICQSGLWLKQGLDAVPLSEQEFRLLEQMVSSAQSFEKHEKYVPTEKLKDSSPAPLNQKNIVSKQPVGTAEIRQYILQKLYTAQTTGETSCTLISGQIHKELGLKNKMPSVCSAMRQVMEPNDIVLHTTASGQSSTIKIQYQLSERKFSLK